jgi:putative nucleotidyltransferase with HDIG domain
MEVVADSVRWEAADFLLKPFSVDAVIRSVARSYQKVVERRESLQSQTQLSLGLRERTIQLENARKSLCHAYRSALESMVAALEAREHGTYAHSYRVRAYAMHLAKLLDYPAVDLSRLAYAALLHDIGKIAVSDAILLKPGKLAPEEFKALQGHSAMGEKIVRRMGFLPEEAKIIRHHHERWDGRGYPDGLREQEIPLGSRIFAIADTLDAMTSDRCYRNSLTITNVQREVRDCSGSQFDPGIASAWRSAASNMDPPPRGGRGSCEGGCRAGIQSRFASPTGSRAR